MYGIQTPYKGADILVDAVGLLSHEYQDHLEVRIMGKMAIIFKAIQSFFKGRQIRGYYYFPII